MVLKSLPGSVRVMSPPSVAVKLLAPLAVMAPVWVMAPPAMTVRLPAVVAPSSRALVSRSATALPAAVTPMRAKSLPLWLSVTAPLPPALTVVAPAAVIDPLVWLMPPLDALRPSVPVAVTLFPSVSPVAPDRVTSPPVTAPVVLSTPPAPTLTALLAPAARAETVRAFLSTTLMAPP